MKPGDILRQRRIRTYGQTDCRNYFEFMPDQEKSKSLQRVFVSLLLGTEHLKLNEKPGEEFCVMPLDEEKALNDLGWWNETQLEEILGVPETQKLLRKLHQFALGKREKAKRPPCSKG